MPATTLTPQQYRWRRRPRRDGSVAHVALVSSLSTGRPHRTGVCRAGVILVRARLGSEYFFLLLFGEKILSSAPFLLSGNNFFAYKK
jgi:hypothetical protein